MTRLASTRRGNVAALARVVEALPVSPENAVAQKRKLLADFCRLLGAEHSQSPIDAVQGLTPRHRQTLTRLLAGDSEKQVAAKLCVSVHTIHVYVKALYRHFEVSSRAELLARFVQPTGRVPDAGASQ